mgnify:CR=1 FL=1
MKKYILLLLTFSSLLTYSQFNNGGMRNQRQRQMPQAQQQAPEPNFNVERYVGFIIYGDIKKVAKKSSIKLSSDVGKKFSSTLNTYNKQVKDIKRINSFTLKSTKEMVENFQKMAMKSGDFSNQIEIQKKMTESLKPIAETLKVEDKKLDKSIKKILSEKQYKKWIKYNRKQGKIFPKEVE